MSSRADICAPGSAALKAAIGHLTQVLAVADAEVRKLGHDPWEPASRLYPRMTQ
jgi:hypothetical protein